MKVVLAGQYPAHTAQRLRALLPEDRFAFEAVDTPEAYGNLSDAEILILRIFNADKAVIERNPNLKMIMRWGAGYDSVDIKAAGERGILVTNTPGANAEAVSELAVMLMLAVGRQLMCYTNSVNAGMWNANAFINSSYCLSNKLVGIVGGGNIGRRVAEKVRAFGAEAQYYDVCRLPEGLEKQVGLRYVSLDTLLRTSDIVTLHVPLFDSTYHMIGAEEIRSMKDGAILINTARGGLVDDRALAKAVDTGKLLGAGLDVVENAPLVINDPMLLNPKIIITPHIGGSTADIADAIIPMLVDDIHAFAGGEMPGHVVNRQFLMLQSTTA